MKVIKTLKDELFFDGVGLHSGNATSVRLIPSDRGGVFFRTTGGEFPISSAVVEEDARLTGFTLPDGSRVRTAEHLLASIAGMELNSIIIMVEGEEVPILDGSAGEFASAMADTGFEERGGSANQICAVPSPVAATDEKKGGVAIALPSDRLRVTYVIDYPGTPIGTQRADYYITPGTFLENISKARTFALVRELDYLQSVGLIKGGSLGNALVFSEERLLNEEGLRFPLEPVTHKVIDLLGDLLLLGGVPVAHYVAICAGHALHGRLVRKLKRTLHDGAR